jgi:hypothetical protein
VASQMQVLEGASVPGAGAYLAQGGSSMQAVLQQVCRKQGLTLTSAQLRELKEQSAVVAGSHDSASAEATNGEDSESSERFTLPDGQDIQLSRRDRQVLDVCANLNANTDEEAHALSTCLGCPKCCLSRCDS